MLVSRMLLVDEVVGGHYLPTLHADVEGLGHDLHGEYDLRGVCLRVAIGWLFLLILLEVLLNGG